MALRPIVHLGKTLTGKFFEHALVHELAFHGVGFAG